MYLNQLQPSPWKRKYASSSAMVLLVNLSMCVPPVGATVMRAVTIRPCHPPWWPSTRAAMPRTQQACGTKIGPTHCSPFPSTDPFMPNFLRTQQSLSAKLSSWEEEFCEWHKEFFLNGIRQGFHIIDRYSGPSKHARSNSHPIWIGLEKLAWNGLDDFCTLACFQIGSI